MKATLPNGSLQELEFCYIKIPGTRINPGAVIKMKILPDISDSKGAEYGSEPIMGRASSMKTFSHSGDRTISWTVHFIATTEEDLKENMNHLRALESCVYPRNGSRTVPYRPPPLLRIRCGELLALEDDLCAILKNYSVKFPPEVAWSSVSYIPYKFDVDLSLEVVYESDDLPGQERIIKGGR